MALPPVELIQVGENYIASDGHHHISVARAMGHEYFDAVGQPGTQMMAAPTKGRLFKMLFKMTRSTGEKEQ